MSLLPEVNVHLRSIALEIDDIHYAPRTVIEGRAADLHFPAGASNQRHWFDPRTRRRIPKDEKASIHGQTAQCWQSRQYPTEIQSTAPDCTNAYSFPQLPPRGRSS